MPFDSGVFKDVYEVKFDKPGLYKYFCHVHPLMRGMVAVDAQLPSAKDQQSYLVYPPEDGIPGPTPKVPGVGEAAQHDEAEVIERRHLDRVIRRESIDERSRALQRDCRLVLVPQEVLHDPDVEREQRDVGVALAECLRVRGDRLLELPERAREQPDLRVDPGQVRQKPSPDGGIVIVDRVAAGGLTVPRARLTVRGARGRRHAKLVEQRQRRQVTRPRLRRLARAHEPRRAELQDVQPAARIELGEALEPRLGVAGRRLGLRGPAQPRAEEERAVGLRLGGLGAVVARVGRAHPVARRVQRALPVAGSLPDL